MVKMKKIGQFAAKSLIQFSYLLYKGGGYDLWKQ